MQVSEGKHKDHTLADHLSSKMSICSKGSRAFCKFSMNLLTVGHQDTQFGLHSPFPHLPPKQRACDSTCCDGQKQQNLNAHLREKQEEARKSCSAISTINYVTLSHLVPFYYLWLPLYFSRYWNLQMGFFLTQLVTILVWLPSSHLGSSSHSLTCKQLQKWLLRLEDGWQHLPSETCTHQK